MVATMLMASNGKVVWRFKRTTLIDNRCMTHQWSNGLRMIDLQVVDAKLVKQIKTESGAAKAEADRIKNGTSSIQKLTKLTQRLSKLVGLFMKL